MEVRQSLGEILSGLGRYGEAMEVEEELLKFYLGKKEANPWNLVLTLNNMALTLSDQDKYSEAENLFLKISSLLGKPLSEMNDPVYSEVVMNYGMVCFNMKKYDLAEKLCRRSLDLKEKTLAQNDPDYLLTLKELGSVYLEQEKLAEAEPLFEKILSVKAEDLSPSHDDVISALQDLVLIYDLQGKTKEAFQVIKKYKGEEKIQRYSRAE